MGYKTLKPLHLADWSDEILSHLAQHLYAIDALLIYSCGDKKFNQRWCKRIVTNLKVIARKKDGKGLVNIHVFEALTALDISFGLYGDLHRLEPIDFDMFPRTLTSLSICCANAEDIFEEVENIIQLREEGLEGGFQIPKSAYQPIFPSLTKLQLSTRSQFKSISRRVPPRFLPESNTSVIYTSFPLVGEKLTKLKIGIWEQALLGLLPDCLEELELETGLVLKSFTAFNILPRSLVSLKGLIITDHSLGLEVDLDVIFDTIARRSSGHRFVTKFQTLEASTESFYEAIWSSLFDWLLDPREPHPGLAKLIDYPPNLQVLHTEFGRYGSSIMFHLPPKLTDLKAKLTEVIGPHHMRYIPDSLTSLHLIGTEDDLMTMDYLIERLPTSLRRLELNRSFLVSPSILLSLPSTMTYLDVHGDKNVSADDYDHLPRSLTVLNLHKIIQSDGAGIEPRLPPSLTRASLPTVWNNEHMSSLIPRSVRSMGVYPPIGVEVVTKWPPGLTALDVAHDSPHANEESYGPVLNYLPRTITVLSCPYAFLGVSKVRPRWPPKMSELAIYRAQRAPLEFFTTLPHGLQCLYLGSTHFQGEHLENLPRSLVWLQLKTPIRAQFVLDLPRHLLALYISIIDPSAECIHSLPESLLFLSCLSYQNDWDRFLPPHCVVSNKIDE